MLTISQVEIAVLFVYVVLILLVGVIPGKIKGRDGFLISERRLRGLSSGFSIAATKIGAGAIITFSALAFRFGAGALWLFISYIIGYAVFYWFAQGLHREGAEKQYYTMADFFEQRYGRPMAVTVGCLCAATLLGWVLTNLIGGSKLISMLTGWPAAVPLALMTITIVLYLVIGGFNAVVRTDVVQYFTLVVIAVIIALAIQATPDAEPDYVTESLPLGRVLALVAFGVLFPLGSAELWQRVYATKSLPQFRWAVVLASVSFLVVGLSVLYACLRIAAVVPSISAGDEELALTKGITSVVSPALGLMWILAFSGAILSSADTFLFTTASAVVQDILQRIGRVSSAGLVVAIRWAILILGSIGIVGALLFGDVLNVTFVFAGLTLILGVLTLVAWKFPKVQPRLLLYSAWIGVGGIILQAIYLGVSEITAVAGAVFTTVAVALGSLGRLRGLAK